MCYGGNPVGFIIKADGITIYHAGDTAAFGDMAMINELYAPDYALLPIGGRFTMGPREAAYALNKFLTGVKVVIPMHFKTFPMIPGSPEELIEHLKEFEGANPYLKVVVPFDFRETEGTLNYH